MKYKNRPMPECEIHINWKKIGSTRLFLNLIVTLAEV